MWIRRKQYEAMERLALRVQELERYQTRLLEHVRKLEVNASVMRTTSGFRAGNPIWVSGTEAPIADVVVAMANHLKVEYVDSTPGSFQVGKKK